MAREGTFDESVARIAVRQVAGLHPEADVIVVDCRPFALVMPNERVHRGTHPVHMGRIVRHSQFGPSQRRVAQLLDAWRRQAWNPSARRPISVAFLDDSGRAGAIALARVMSEVLIRSANWAFQDARELTPSAHSELQCRPCELCQFWARRFECSQQILQEALAWWNLA
jgi:hypothetical protein